MRGLQYSVQDLSGFHYILTLEETTCYPHDLMGSFILVMSSESGSEIVFRVSTCTNSVTMFVAPWNFNTPIMASVTLEAALDTGALPMV
ncbi:hypothetical protein TNCV_4406411 [Trichonephila clavipes]|nr:hypothetical protein TNCV_4406411 [Trichonephila clavipes]